MEDENKKSINMKSFRNIFKEVYGNDYLGGLDGDNFISMTDLKKIAINLNINPEETFIDIGCGKGGPGMWIAREIGANYFGIDISEIGIEVAKSRIKDFGLEGKAQFKIGDICATDLPDNCFHGAIGIDSLGFVSDPLAAFNEVARVLRKSASFVVTCWEEEQSSSMKDIHFFFRKAGFVIKLYEEVTDWERRQREVYQKVLESKKILIKDMGLEAAFIPIMEAKKFLPLLKYMKHVLVVAEKP
jgi:ubiquinone/menaquinone biosynthesis C-methylase UbiE